MKNPPNGGGGGPSEGVTSLNSLTGALAITTPNSTMIVGTSGLNVTTDINLANANQWTASQSQFGGAWQVNHASLDANPTSQLGDGFLKFGAGGANALDVSISRIGAINTAIVTWVQNAIQVFRITNLGILDLINGSIRPLLLQAALSSNYSNASTTIISTGVGVSEAVPNTAFMVNATFAVSNSVLGDSTVVYIVRSTTSIPAAGSAINTGDVDVYSSPKLGALAANLITGLSCRVLDSSLAAGTIYYYYIAMNSITGGTSTIYSGINATSISIEPA